MHQSYPKYKYVRSKRLIEAYRLLPCQFDPCFSRGTLPAMACHSNWAIHGKGGAIKASDDRCASGCAACHHELDQGHRLGPETKAAWWWDAHNKTVQKLQELGAWPVKIAAPDTDIYPF